MALDGKIYAVGGMDEDCETLDTVEVYDPQANSWQLVARMPQGRANYAAAAIGGKIYVTGGAGSNQGTSANSAYVYDPQANAWTQLASMGTARESHASAAVGGKLYVFRGYGTSGRLSTVEVYDPASDSWAQVTSLTSARTAVRAVAL